jgi:hypothetical protein
MRTLVICAALLVSIFRASGAEMAALRVERLPENPIIRPEMLPGRDGANINGPSLIRVPSRVKNPLGRYYLYFAHRSHRAGLQLSVGRARSECRRHQRGGFSSGAGALIT